jgi:hypothetical protein
MTSEEQQRMRELCQQIIVEKDQGKMLQLVEELNELLGAKEKRLRSLANSPNS